MNKLERINAIKEFMSYSKVTDAIKIEASVEVYDDGNLIHKGNADVYCSYEVSYMQYSVTIIWSFDDAVMRKMGLHGSYNTNYQDFVYSNGLLTVIADNIEIIISKRYEE